MRDEGWKFIFFSLTAMLLMLGSMIAFGAVRQEPPSFSISISASKDDIKSGEPVEIKVTITNTSDHDVDVSSSWEAGADMSLEYDVHDTTGNPSRRKARREGPIIASGRVATLKPGESIEETTLVSAVCDMSLPGQYVIQVARRISTDTKQGKVKSNDITVSVKP